MLLSLSIVVSLFGIVNTLVLTVFERTRELGMLRAVGMSRRQVRRMIRHESVITALLGAAFGIPLGILLAALIGATIDFGTFTIPVGHADRVRDRRGDRRGLIAAIWPARRAGRLNVLRSAVLRIGEIPAPALIEGRPRSAGIPGEIPAYARCRAATVDRARIPGEDRRSAIAVRSQQTLPRARRYAESRARSPHSPLSREGEFGFTRAWPSFTSLAPRG